MACFTKDANRHSDHNFSSFLTPKTCSLTYNNNLSFNKQEDDDDLPELTSSIYTNSTYSSASLSFLSIFTRRATLLARAKKYQQEEEEEEEYSDYEEEQIECCDYCENLNKKANDFMPTTIKLQKPVYISSPPPLLSNFGASTSSANNKNFF